MDKMFLIANNRDEIRKWVEKHNGQPAILDDTEVGGDEIGLRINFPGSEDENMLSVDRKVTRNIDWNKFFEIMDDKNLLFESLDEESLHNPSMSYRFLDRKNPQVDEKEELSQLV